MADYALAVSEAEITRYRLMAQMALTGESRQLGLAGISAGAVVADVGCGPAAMSVELAALVGPSGRVIAVEREEEARAAARDVIAGSGAANVELREGTATSTGIEPGSVDVVMMRHVLAHNGGEEQDIVDHLASLVRPGGSVYLVDVDLTGMRMLDSDPELADLVPLRRVPRRSRQRSAGRTASGATARQRRSRGPGLHRRLQHHRDATGIPAAAVGPRDTMVAEGSATPDEVTQWGAAFDRPDAAPVRPTVFAPLFIGLGRKP